MHKCWIRQEKRETWAVELSSRWVFGSEGARGGEKGVRGESFVGGLGGLFRGRGELLRDFLPGCPGQQGVVAN